MRISTLGTRNADRAVTQVTFRTRSDCAYRFVVCVLMAGPLTVVAAYGQTNPEGRAAREVEQAKTAPYGQTNPDGRTYIVGNVDTSGNHTLIVRADNCQAQLFVYDAYTVKPKVIAGGARVRVLSVPTSEYDVRRAISVVADTSTPPPADPKALPCEPVEPTIWISQRQIERDGRLWHWGFRGGVGLDPEIIVVGAQVQFGPFFSRYLLDRPTFDFGWGQATQSYAINLDWLLRWPDASRTAKWYPYLGAGPHLTFENLDIGNTSSDFHTVWGLNLLGGMQYRSGMFLEGRVSVYSRPASTVKLLVGYNF